MPKRTLLAVAAVAAAVAVVATLAVVELADRSPAAATVGQGGPMDAMGGMAGMAGMGMKPESEFAYLARMIPHHEEAIAAAEVLRAGTERAEMRRFAESIIDTQTAEVTQMRAWLAAWYPRRDTQVDYDPMMGDLTQLRGDALDQAFLADMIPHHMMAVMMSQQFVAGDRAEHDDVVPFAEGIRDAQHEEIQTMAGWLRDWFGASPHGAGMGMHHGGG